MVFSNSIYNANSVYLHDDFICNLLYQNTRSERRLTHNETDFSAKNHVSNKI